MAVYAESYLKRKVARFTSAEELSAALLDAENAKREWIKMGVLEPAKFYTEAAADIKERLSAVLRGEENAE